MKNKYTVSGKIFVSDIEISDYSIKHLFCQFFEDLLKKDFDFELAKNEWVEPNIKNNTFEKVKFDYCDYHKGEDVVIREVLREMTTEEKENWNTFYRLTRKL